LVGQGATEYLVLLAVVLIVALVSVALLGFFPGMAGDAKITQSQAYWQGASPIQITEFGAWKRTSGSGQTSPYLRVRNAGAYPIRITKVWGNGAWASYVHNTTADLLISDNYYLAPGEEKLFGAVSGLIKYVFPIPSAANNSIYIGADAFCDSSPPYGTLSINSFGFEYVEYIDGQQITKKQLGGPLVIKCSEPKAPI